MMKNPLPLLSCLLLIGCGEKKAAGGNDAASADKVAGEAPASSERGILGYWASDWESTMKQLSKDELAQLLKEGAAMGIDPGKEEHVNLWHFDAADRAVYTGFFAAATCSYEFTSHGENAGKGEMIHEMGAIRQVSSLELDGDKLTMKMDNSKSRFSQNEAENERVRESMQSVPASVYKRIDEAEYVRLRGLIEKRAPDEKGAKESSKGKARP